MRREDLERLLGTGKKQIKNIEIADNGEVVITFLVRGKTVTLAGPVKSVEDAPTTETPWEDAGWLGREFRTHGSLRAVAKAHDFSAETRNKMILYARHTLGWRIQDGNELKRWAFLTHYFEEVDPKARPTFESICTELGISLGNAALWKREALAGKFFSNYFTYEKLVALQVQSRAGTHYVYFPGSDFTLADFSLAQMEGWPTLPTGLLSDLLPKLNGFETQGVTMSSRHLRLQLDHYGTPLDTKVALANAPAALESDATLEAIEALEHGVNAYYFAVGERRVEVLGKLTHVLQASTNADYKVRP